MDNKHVNILGLRSSGILLPVFSLPGPFGIGDVGPSARQFIDFLHSSGQSCWQILPVNPTNAIFGNSPYMSYSSFAGNPLFISPELLLEQGLVGKSEATPPVFCEYSVKYAEVAAFKERLLAAAWKNYQHSGLLEDTLGDFTRLNPWVNDHGLFLALKETYKEKPWYKWPPRLRHRHPETLVQASRQHRERIQYHIFVQYLFFMQWQLLRAYAEENGIHIIGDLPIYVAQDSVDVWAHPAIFQLDAQSGEPTHVAGVPPDYFSVTGQRWGNPLYRWDLDDPDGKKLLWDWWEQRLRINFTLADTIRIDHFRGFESYWSVPAEEKTALNGQWEPGPGATFFREMDRRLGGMSIIAEDLGMITPEVEELRQELAYPGMKILLFAFDGNRDNSYLPYNCEKNSVVYTGTHDNDTAVGWCLSPQVPLASKQLAKRFANRVDDHAGFFHRDLIHIALSSAPNLAIIPLQDVLGFGNDCRINTPGTTENNWLWRCASRFLAEDIATWLREMTETFGRLPSPPEEDTPASEHTDL
ncbi:4-alpha-glucanotransferase [Desulfobulbus alkaliphilus]|uniref:4-alpha-glucanotransferase n=1 Tax=Desulfobulbus alkaliphilus TaxID=869814 RepID=UPI001963C2E2|nr:4-alpha-glucanotransferase [Desulfobulbus alkaliphilus]MBM9538420.1 4-alpha-glucanotransferase [Desulfobulbus alkaliphilus]